MASTNRIAWTYRTATGATYRVSAIKAYTDQDKLGGEAAADGLQAKPRGLRMRTVMCQASGGVLRAVPAYSVTAAIWTTPGTHVTLNHYGADTDFAAGAEHRDESFGRQTKQTA